MTFAFDRFTYKAQSLASSGASGDINFNKWSFPLPSPTSMVWGPDGRLYVTEVFGTIHALTLALENQEVISDQVISTLRTTYGGNRLTLGITIDPTSTANNVIL